MIARTQPIPRVKQRQQLPGLSVLRVLRVFRHAGRLAMALFLLLVLFQGVTPIGFMLATALLVGEIPTIVTDPDAATSRAVLLPLLLLALLYAVQQVLGPIRQAVEESIGEQLQDLLRQRLFAALTEPHGLAHLEDPSLATDVEVARGIGQQGRFDRRTVWALTEVLSARIQGAVAAIILFQFRWWAPLLLIAAKVLHLAWHEREVSTLTSQLERSTFGLRRGRYFRDLTLSEGTAKEIRLFGLSNWAVAQFARHWLDTMRDIWAQRQRHRGLMTIAIISLIASQAVVFIALGQSALAGSISLAAIVFYAQAVLGTDALGVIGEPERLVTQASRTGPAIERLPQRIAASGANLQGARMAFHAPREEIRLDDVAFRYSGSDRDVLSGLDLTIPAGQSLAIVGVNGAGKTSLVKLLARLYDPVSGAITVDGHDLRTIDPDSWRTRLGIIFQDFAKYHFSVRENVALSWPARMHNDDAVHAALSQVGLSDFITLLPEGLDTPLSRAYPGGLGVSGGQWQRIALARALFTASQGADVLILDEPTANLDVRVEAELFELLLSLMHGKTCVLVSHRLSSVRRADRIVVLDGGRVVEDGTHDALLAGGGNYARLFHLQAQPFTEFHGEPHTPV